MNPEQSKRTRFKRNLLIFCIIFSENIQEAAAFISILGDVDPGLLTKTPETNVPDLVDDFTKNIENYLPNTKE